MASNKLYISMSRELSEDEMSSLYSIVSEYAILDEEVVESTEQDDVFSTRIDICEPDSEDEFCYSFSTGSEDLNVDGLYKELDCTFGNSVVLIELECYKNR